MEYVGLGERGVETQYALLFISTQAVNAFKTLLWRPSYPLRRLHNFILDHGHQQSDRPEDMPRIDDVELSSDESDFEDEERENDDRLFRRQQREKTSDKIVRRYY